MKKSNELMKEAEQNMKVLAKDGEVKETLKAGLRLGFAPDFLHEILVVASAAGVVAIRS